MCFSPQISIITFYIGILGSFLSYSIGNVSSKIIGIYFAYISLMQLLEYLLWNHQKCDKYNKFISIITMIINHSQPLVLAFIMLLFNPFLLKNLFFLSITTIYFIFIIPYSYYFLINKKKLCTIKGNKKYGEHLVWNWVHQPYNILIYILYLLTVFTLCILGFPNLLFGIIMGLILLISYILTYIFYSSDKELGSLWCFFSAFFPIIYYIIIKLFNKN